MADATGTADADFGRAVYEAEGAWLDEFAPAGRNPAWDSLDPEYRDVYRRLGSAVAAAVRERLAGLLEARGHEMARAAVNSGGPAGAGKRARADGVLEAARIIREGNDRDH